MNQGDIAIIGMACMFPGAPDLERFWQNILGKVDALSDPPPEAWPADTFFDPASQENDRVYCKRGGYLGPLAYFDPLAYGIMPGGIEGGEPDQWLALKVAYAAIADAGYLERLQQREDERQRTAVILGKGTYLNHGNLNMVQHSLVVEQTLQVLRTLYPEYSQEELQAIRSALKQKLPPFQAETAPGLVPNIVAGRIANRLDLMGPTYTVDAACASALVAVESAISELRSGNCDLALAGGVHVTTPIPVLTLFCRLNALSRRQQIRPFDRNADGTILGEGLGMLLLKRRADAERDGDRIYALIKAIGTASDGRALSVLAPRVEGQTLALRRAYALAGIDPRSVELIEAHGTGTPAGDRAEIQTLIAVLGERENGPPRCAVGSVKSMIGHTMPAAGIAGLIKAALALYQRVLPPTINCDEPDPALGLEHSAFYINTEVRPWLPTRSDAPRRAGVNAFGFGGVNAHAVLEEAPLADEARSPSQLRHWESEVIFVEGESREALLAAIRRVLAWLEHHTDQALLDLAYTLNRERRGGPWRLALVAHSPADLREKLAHGLQRLADPACRQIKDVKGSYFFAAPLYPAGKVAFLFPGEGSQYPHMLADLCMHFPELRACFEAINRVFIGHRRGYLPSDVIFPRPAHAGDGLGERIWQIDGAVEAVLTANQALALLLERLGVRPDLIVGHSTGEYSALRASGMLPLDDEAFIGALLELNHSHEEVSRQLATPQVRLIAVGASRAQVEALIAELGAPLYIGMDNCPHQCVVVGEADAADQLVALLKARSLIFEVLPFGRAYHSPLFSAYRDTLRDFFAHLPLGAARIPAYSCTTAAPYPADTAAIREVALEHWVSPVRFSDTIRALYADGARIFVEAGARGNLCAFVGDILRGQPHLAIPANLQQRGGISQLNHLLAMLGAQGVPLQLEYLYQRRRPKELAIEGEAEPRKASREIKLKTGWVAMEIEPEAAARLRHTAMPVPANGERPPSPPVRATPLPPRSPAEGQPAARPTGAGTRGAVVQGHLQLMEQFLASQQRLMGQFLDGRAPSASPPAVATPVQAQATSLPFIRTIRELIPGQELVAECLLDPAEDRFLLDHTLGRAISLSDPQLTALPLVPLTVSMEIMAEAAARLFPELVVVELSAIRAYRWILFEEGPRRLRINVRRADGPESEVLVALHEDDLLDQEVTTPIIECRVRLAATYPSPPTPIAAPAPGPSRWRPANIYREGMFHGPLFQAVTSVEQSSAQGMVATLSALPPAGFLRSAAAPRFLAEPVLLDAAGQLVGLWTVERLEQDFVVFPYRCAALQIFGPPLQPPEQLTGLARIAVTDERHTSSDIDLLDQEGRVRLRLAAWEDRRFALPRRLYDFILAPQTTLLGENWPAALNGTAMQAIRVAGLEAQLLTAHHGFWSKVLAYLTLNRREREQWRSLNGSPKRRADWLLGRITAKEAVRLFVQRNYGLSLCPADVEIASDEYGRPLVRGAWLAQIDGPLVISLAHSDGIAVALAGQSSGGVGIDLEPLRRLEQGFDQVAFTASEQVLLRSLVQAEGGDWPLRLWCAKEAVGKALGRGLAGGPQSLVVQEVDPRSGTVQLRPAGDLARLFPAIGTRLLTARTVREGNFVVASAHAAAIEG